MTAIKTDRNPLFYAVTTVWHTKGRLAITHRYDDSFRLELTFADLARAAGVIGDANGPEVVHYRRLWSELQDVLRSRGLRAVYAYGEIEIRSLAA